MRHPFNYLSLLSLPALAALIYFPTGDADFLGFLGFLVFLRYLWVNPDELFLLTLRRRPPAPSWLSACSWLRCCSSFTSWSPLQPHAPGPGPQLRPLPDLLLPVPHLAGVEGKQGLRMSLRTKIRELRLRDRLSQEELAQRVGVRRETIGHLENGHYNPSLKLAMDIAHVFGCTVEDIFSFED